MPSALLYGHSQTGGMGIDQEKALKSAGFTTSRVVHNGKNDAALLALTSDLTEKQANADRVFLYAGGNSDASTVPEITALIDYFGPERVTVILPPVNQGRDDDKIAAQRAKNAANVEGLALQSDTRNVRVYSIEAPYDQFSSNTDHVHLAAGSQASKDFAQRVIDEMDGGMNGAILLVAALVFGAVWLAWLRK